MKFWFKFTKAQKPTQYHYLTYEDAHNQVDGYDCWELDATTQAACNLISPEHDSIYIL